MNKPVPNLTDEETMEVLQAWLDDGRLDIEAVLEELTQDQIWRILAKYVLKP